MISISQSIEKNRKEYYRSLQSCNRSLDAQDFAFFFSRMILEAQASSIAMVQHVIHKTQLFASLKGQINLRQEKVLLRVFREGPAGFEGGLSAGRYMTIAKTSAATARRDLADLVQLGALNKTGEKKGRRYWLASE